MTKEERIKQAVANWSDRWRNWIGDTRKGGVHGRPREDLEKIIGELMDKDKAGRRSRRDVESEAGEK